MKIYKVNPHPFISISSPLNAYILGLLWADGYVKPPYQISLSSTHPDADYFIPIFLKTGEWKFYSRHPDETRKRLCEIKTSNRTLVDFLIENDYTSKSSIGAMNILSKIPENIRCYWFRGFFDGDGYIYTDNNGCHRISFSGPIDQEWDHLLWLCKKTNTLGVIHKDVRETGSGSVFTIYGMYPTINVCNFLYSGYPTDGIGLHRKYDKFIQLKNTEEKNRFKGICEYKSGSQKGKWRAYTSSAGGEKPQHLGVFKSKEDATKCVENFYSTHPRVFLS